MTLKEEDLIRLVIGHLAEILGGRCTVTHAQIESETDPIMAELLAGIICLHEDFVFKESERDRAERELRGVAERLAEQNRELEGARKELELLAAELATPVITVWKGVLLMPLVGSVDAERAQDIMRKVLAAVVSANATYVILDLTGVTVVDTATADHLARIMSAVQIVGAQGILAGTQPAVASAISGIGVDLSGISTVRDVQAALKLCMREGGVRQNPAPTSHGERNAMR